MMDTKRKIIITLLIFVILAVIFSWQLTTRQAIRPEPAAHNVTPAGGLVPDQTVAIAIAEAVLGKIYGAENIQRQKPFQVELVKGIWIVVGTLPTGHNLGGVAQIEITQSDGRILRVTHGK